jgi:hypothetical protein
MVVMFWEEFCPGEAPIDGYTHNRLVSHVKLDPPDPVARDDVLTFPIIVDCLHEQWIPFPPWRFSGISGMAMSNSV